MDRIKQTNSKACSLNNLITSLDFLVSLLYAQMSTCVSGTRHAAAMDVFFWEENSCSARTLTSIAATTVEGRETFRLGPDYVSQSLSVRGSKKPKNPFLVSIMCMH